MDNILQFKSKDDYSEHTVIKNVDGEKVEVFNIDAMSEDQFKKFCKDNGTEYFQRFGITI